MESKTSSDFWTTLLNGIDKGALFILSIVLVFGFVMLNRWYKRKWNEDHTESGRSRLLQLGVMLYAAYGFVFLLFFNGMIIYYVSDQSFLYDMSVALIVSWVVVLIGYYAWALYFYNINFGWTDEDWRQNERELRDDPTNAVKPPERNPFYDQTLGLPPGTVRGTIALTLLVCGVAFVIAALNMKNSVAENTVLVDNFDFFKKAFLMMIAFYFGTKSLEILQGKEGKETKDGAATTTTAATATDPAPVTEDATPATIASDSTGVLPAEPQAATVTSDDLQKEFNLSGAKG
jgi:hypothetical protein